MDRDNPSQHPEPAHVQRALYCWLRDRAAVVLPPVDAELRRLASDLPRPRDGHLSAQIDELCGWLERASEDWRGIPEWMSRTLELLRLDQQDGQFAELVSRVEAGANMSRVIVVTRYGGTVAKNDGFGTTEDGLCILSRHKTEAAAKRRIETTHALRHEGPFEVRFVLPLGGGCTMTLPTRDEAVSRLQATHNHASAALADLQCSTSLVTTRVAMMAAAAAEAAVQRLVVVVGDELRRLDSAPMRLDCQACGHELHDHVPFGGCRLCSCGATDLPPVPPRTDGVVEGGMTDGTSAYRWGMARDARHPRAARHRPCGACRGRGGRWSDQGHRVAWLYCDTCHGHGTLTRLCEACDGPGGRVVAGDWRPCDVCMGTGRATARGRPPSSRGLSGEDLAELQAWGTLDTPTPVPPTDSQDDGRTGGTGDAPGAAPCSGARGVVSCREGGGLACVRWDRRSCERCR